MADDVNRFDLRMYDKAEAVILVNAIAADKDSKEKNSPKHSI